jgi:uncharacterized protein (DUF1501 family)
VLLKGGTWPGFVPGGLYRGQDLPATTDFRSVFAEALVRHLLVQQSDLPTILSGFSISASDQAVRKGR